MNTILLDFVMLILAALFGGFFGALYPNWFQQRKVGKVRNLAIRALRIFEKYAKDGQTYDLAANDFNNELDIVEKRAVLVALCKLGIPVEKTVDSVFDIKNVRFERKVISKNTIGLMMGQLNKGNCDSMFFSDIDEYFSSNNRLLAVRAVAKKYVDEDLSKCRCDKERMQVTHPDIANNKFTPGELNVLNVFRFRTCLDTYFDEAGNANPQKMEQLKKEIDLGIWDTYLFWDWESYQIMQNQNNMAIAFANVIKNNAMQQQPTTNIENEVGKEIPSKP